ncbi:MAG: ABC transporter permease [Dehalobacterium sp.]
MRDFYREFKLFLSSPWRVVLFLIFPILITVYYGLVFSDGVIEQGRIVIVDRDQTAVSRNLVQQFRDNKGFRVVQDADSVATALTLVWEEKADMVLAVPDNFSRDIKKGKSPSLLVIPNAANMAISSNAMKRASEIILTFNGGLEIKKLEAKGYNSYQAEKIALPLQLHYRQIRNPSGNFYDFLVWGLIGAIGHFPIMVFSATALDRKKEEIGHKKFLFRFLVYVLFGMGELLLSLLVGVAFFPMTFFGGLVSVIYLVLLVGLFAMAVTALGMLLSLLVPDRAMASQAASIVALPALILSGYTWPMSGFPWFIRLLGCLEPLTYFADPLRRLVLTGRVEYDYWYNCAILLIMFLILFGTILVVLGKGKAVKMWHKHSFSH